MKHTAKEYHVWKRKDSNKAIGKVVDIAEGDTIDNYIEIELPEPFKKMIDTIKEWREKQQNNKDK